MVIVTLLKHIAFSHPFAFLCVALNFCLICTCKYARVVTPFFCFVFLRLYRKKWSKRILGNISLIVREQFDIVSGIAGKKKPYSFSGIS